MEFGDLVFEQNVLKTLFLDNLKISCHLCTSKVHVPFASAASQGSPIYSTLTQCSSSYITICVFILSFLSLLLWLIIIVIRPRSHTKFFTFFHFFSLGSEKILRSHTPERKIFTFEVKNFLAVTHKIFH